MFFNNVRIIFMKFGLKGKCKKNIFCGNISLRPSLSNNLETVFRQGCTLLDQGCPNFDKHFSGASVHEKIEI